MGDYLSDYVLYRYRIRALTADYYPTLLQLRCLTEFLRHREHWTLNMAQHSLRRAAAQGVEKVPMALGREHQQVRLPKRRLSENRIHRIAIQQTLLPVVTRLMG